MVCGRPAEVWSAIYADLSSIRGGICADLSLFTRIYFIYVFEFIGVMEIGIGVYEVRQCRTIDGKAERDGVSPSDKRAPGRRVTAVKGAEKAT